MKEERSGETGKVAVLICSETIGRGNDELGANLMMNFLHHLSISDDPPDFLIMMNSGVKLATESTDVLETLRELEKRNIQILACGTCLDFFQLREKQRVGRGSNMREISQILVSASKVVSV
ncbi:MAG: sulfurtransferase-like selenium metabolism protein YedF [Candidatus Abyssobacteria bacterium SURF_5]|uniref:Sulfurtransferase-like selenium metabolism protein YedF n=1 Tax=Abyssobacteria bacterium (strain SURF_5) TaxID=2093360 RepID=A0A3A4NQV9_ABYX5|nr:MAG: sulfurtransferase-like selenium metabolism protein YedF [Candidatus Abyssubacteria bacterium SURF_5]